MPSTNQAYIDTFNRGQQVATERLNKRLTALQELLNDAIAATQERERLLFQNTLYLHDSLGHREPWERCSHWACESCRTLEKPYREAQP